MPARDESHDISAEQPEIAAEMERRLRSMIDLGLDQGIDSMDDKTLELLRSLGYIQ